MRHICSIDMPCRTYHGRGGAGRRGGGSCAEKNNRPSWPPAHRRQPFWTFLRKRDQNILYFNIFLRDQNTDILWAGRDGARQRTEERRDVAERGKTIRRRVGSPRKQPSCVATAASKTTVLNDSSKARTKETLCKPMDEHDNRLTSG